MTDEYVCRYMTALLYSLIVNILSNALKIVGKVQMPIPIVIMNAHPQNPLDVYFLISRFLNASLFANSLCNVVLHINHDNLQHIATKFCSIVQVPRTCCFRDIKLNDIAA